MLVTRRLGTSTELEDAHDTLAGLTQWDRASKRLRVQRATSAYRQLDTLSDPDINRQPAFACHRGLAVCVTPRTKTTIQDNTNTIMLTVA